MKGWYSLVQYCPDPSQSEFANVGVVLIVPERGLVLPKFASHNDRPRRYFHVASDALTALNNAKHFLQNRINREAAKLVNFEHFEQFRQTRGNDLILSSPRNVRVEDPFETLTELFDELVGGRAIGDMIHRERGLSALVPLRNVFERDVFDGIVKVPTQPVPVPYTHAKFRADFEYKNGQTNLLKALVIRPSVEETTSLHAKTVLYAELLGKQNVATVTFALPEPTAKFAEAYRQLTAMLKSFSLATVAESDLDAFGQRVLAEAH